MTAALTIDTTDVTGTAEAVAVRVFLADSKGRQTVGFYGPSNEFTITGVSRFETADDGTLTIQLVPNADVTPENTYYSVAVADFVFLIDKLDITQSLIEAMIATPAALGAMTGIDALTDVDTSSDPPEHGEALVWDNDLHQWVPGVVATSGGATSLDELSDVDTTTVPPTNGQALVFETDHWEPGTVASGGGAPTGPAGGVLSGTYPNPGFAADMATQAELDTTQADVDAHEALTTTAHGGIVSSADSRLTDSRNPTGPAGGVLSGTYPNPSFGLDIATQGELDAHTALTTTAHGGLVASSDPRLTDSRAPTGAAGGVLGGTYPNPSFAADMATQAELDAAVAPKVSGPGSAVNDRIAVFDGTTGKLIKDGGSTLASIAPISRNSGAVLPGIDPNLAHVTADLDGAAYATPGVDLVLIGDSIMTIGGAEFAMYELLAMLYNGPLLYRPKNGFVAANGMTKSGVSTETATFKENGVRFTAASQSITTTQTADGMIWLVEKGTGTLTFKVDGTTATTQDVSLLPVSGHCNLVSVDATTMASHTFSIESSGGTVSCRVPGGLPTYGNRTKGVRFWSAAVAGDTTAEYNTNSYKAMDLINALSNAGKKVHAINALGFNDPNNPTTDDSALMTTLRTVLITGTNDILRVSTWWNFASDNDLVQQEYIRATAESKSAAFFSFGRLFGDVAQTMDSWGSTGDGVHPTGLTGDLIGYAIAGVFSGNTVGVALTNLARMRALLATNPSATTLGLQASTALLSSVGGGGFQQAPVMELNNGTSGLVKAGMYGGLGPQVLLHDDAAETYPVAALVGETYADLQGWTSNGGALVLSNGGSLTPDVNGLWHHAAGIIRTNAAIVNPNAYVRKPGTESVTSSTTLQDDDDLFLALIASAEYTIRGVLIVDGAQAGDIKVSFTAPSGAVVNIALTGSTTGTTTEGATRTQLMNAGTSGSFGTIGAGATSAMGFIGMVRTGVTAGNIRVQWAQDASSGTPTRVWVDSWMAVERRS